MTRSAPSPRSRTSTGIRLDDALHERLAAAAADHGVTFNWLINRAVGYFLDRLLPAAEVRWTRDDPEPADPDPTTATAWVKCPEHGPYCRGAECCCADKHPTDPFPACWVASDRLVHLFAGTARQDTYCGQPGIGSFVPDGGTVEVTCPTCAAEHATRYHTVPRA